LGYLARVAGARVAGARVAGARVAGARIAGARIAGTTNQYRRWLARNTSRDPYIMD
jgi:hypothetical protein